MSTFLTNAVTAPLIGDAPTHVLDCKSLSKDEPWTGASVPSKHVQEGCFLCGGKACDCIAIATPSSTDLVRSSIQPGTGAKDAGPLLTSSNNSHDPDHTATDQAVKPQAAKSEDLVRKSILAGPVPRRLFTSSDVSGCVTTLDVRPAVDNDGQTTASQGPATNDEADFPDPTAPNKVSPTLINRPEIGIVEALAHAQKLILGELNSFQAHCEAQENHLKEQLEELKAAHTELQKNYAELEAAHTELQKNNRELEAAHTELQKNNTELEAAHTELQKSSTEKDQIIGEKDLIIGKQGDDIAKLEEDMANLTRWVEVTVQVGERTMTVELQRFTECSCLMQDIFDLAEEHGIWPDVAKMKDIEKLSISGQVIKMGDTLQEHGVQDGACLCLFLNRDAIEIRKNWRAREEQWLEGFLAAPPAIVLRSRSRWNEHASAQNISLRWRVAYAHPYCPVY